MLTNEQIGQKVVKTIKDHDRTFTSLKEKWTDLYRRYENKAREGSITEDCESPAYLGAAFSTVEQFVARMFARPPRFKYQARERGDAKPGEVYGKFSQYQWDDNGADSDVETIAKYGAITGLAPYEMVWQETREVKKDRVNTIAGVEVKSDFLKRFAKKTTTKKAESVHKNWKLEAISPFDYVWSVDAINPCDAEVQARKYVKTIDEMKSMGFNTKDIEQSIKDTGEDYYRQIINGEVVEVDINEERCAFYKAYTRINNGEYYEYHVVYVSVHDQVGEHVLKIEENPFDQKFIPMSAWRPIERPGKYYGFGMIEPVVGVLDAEEDTFNMAKEAIWTDIARPMEYNPMNVYDIDALEYRSRSLVPVRQLGQSVKTMDAPKTDMASVSFAIGYLGKTRQEITAITDYQTGADKLGGSKTLGEIQIKTAQSDQRSSKMLRSLEQEVLFPIGKWALHMNKQYLADDKELIYRITGKKGSINEEKIKFSDIEAVKDLSIISGSSVYAIQQEEQSKYLNLMQALQIPAQMGVKVDFQEIAQRLVEEGFQIKDSENIIPSLREVEEEEVKGGVSEMNKAKKENEQPMVARVSPNDNHEVHMQLHQAAAQSGTKENGQVMSPEEHEALLQHIDDHTQAMGGVGSRMRPQEAQQQAPQQPMAQ